MDKMRGKLFTGSLQLTFDDLLTQAAFRRSTAPAKPEGHNIKAEMCAAISRMVRKAGKSRQEIAETMSTFLGESITVSMLDGFTALARPNRFPAEWIHALCIATGSYEILELIIEPLPKELIDEDEADYIDLGKAMAYRKLAVKAEHKILRKRGL